MQVNKPVGDTLRPTSASKPSAVSPATAQPPRHQSVGGGTALRTDQVEISDAGRTLAGAAAHEGVSLSTSALDSARLDDIRTKVASGAYLSPEVTDHVARAILSRGDI